jgi:hypothetical protein
MTVYNIKSLAQYVADKRTTWPSHLQRQPHFCICNTANMSVVYTKQTPFMSHSEHTRNLNLRISKWTKLKYKLIDPARLLKKDLMCKLDGQGSKLSISFHQNKESKIHTIDKRVVGVRVFKGCWQVVTSRERDCRKGIWMLVTKGCQMRTVWYLTFHETMTGCICSSLLIHRVCWTPTDGTWYICS